MAISLQSSPVLGGRGRLIGVAPLFGVLSCPSPPFILCVVGKEVQTNVSQMQTGSISSAESSLLALIESVVANKEESQGEIIRLREEFESLSKDIVSLVGEARKASIPPTASVAEGSVKKKRTKRSRRVSGTDPLPPPRNPASEVVKEGPASRSVQPSVSEVSWATVTSRSTERDSQRNQSALVSVLCPVSGNGARTPGGGSTGKAPDGFAARTERITRADRRTVSMYKMKEREKDKAKVSGPRLLSTAVVSITLLPDCKRDFRSMMSEARQKISLDQLGIANPRIRPAVN